MTRKSVLSMFTVLLALTLSGFAGHAADDFYAGKTVRILVAYAPGGGFDAYSRLLARHLPRHIPGNPTVVVQNRPGAGGLITANFMYKKAKPDGLTIGHWVGGLILQQYLGNEKVLFDAAKMGWIGAPVRITNVCMTHKKSGVVDLATWRAAKQPVKFGGSQPGSTLWDIPRILIAHTDLPMRLIEGYGGTAPVRVAAEKGEVAGVCASWEGLKNPWAAQLASGDVRVLAQFVDKPHSELAGIPLTNDVIKSDVGRQVMNIVIRDIGGALNRPYSLPPGTPKDRLMVLRRAFDAAMKDPELLAEAKKSRFLITPVTGEDVDRLVAGVAGLQPELLASIKKTFAPKK